MEKYGCNRIEEIEERIKEILNRKIKTASEDEELTQLYNLLQDLKDRDI